MDFPLTRESDPVSVAKFMLMVIPLPALTVKALKVEGLLWNLTVLVAPVAFRVTVPVILLLLAAEIPSTVISELVSSPSVRFTPRIPCSSGAEIVMPPAVAPRPMVAPSETLITIFPAPALI